MELFYPAGQVEFLPRPTAARPGRPEDLIGEKFPVVEPSGEVVGITTRRLAHGGTRLLHPTVHLHVLRRDGMLYLQRRALTKRNYPGFWDSSVGGHVDFGEHILDALFRETEEEIGLTEFHPIALKTYVYSCPRECELVSVFACVGNFELHPDPVEIAEGRWWSFKEIEDNLGKSVFTPNFEEEFAGISQMLLALL